MKEVWKDIKGYEGLYQVSNLGKIKSLYGYNGHKYIKRVRILKLSICRTNKNYKRYKITLVKNKKK